MDILYIIGPNSLCNNFELRCSLRSIEQFGKNVGRVFVVGDCPDWLSDEVIKLEHKSVFENPTNLHEKHINMVSNLLYAIDNSDISEHFLVSMDDHFYVSEIDFDNYPIYCRQVDYNKDLIYLPDTRQDVPYTDFLVDSRELLLQLNLSVYNFILHRNMHCWKSIINELRPVISYMIETKKICELFGLILNYKYSQDPFDFLIVKDVKLTSGAQWYKTDPNKTHVFSTADFTNNSGLYVLLSGLYNKPSKYEINGDNYEENVNNVKYEENS